MATKPATLHELNEGAREAADAAPDVEFRVSHNSLASALVAALEELTIVRTGRTVKVKTKGDGPDYSYDYADLGDVVKLTRPALALHGLVALTPVHDHGAGLACTVTILHDGGERMDFGPFPFPHGRDAQATGSMVTYHRRYALVAALGMAAGDDDDGAAAKPAEKVDPRTVGWGKDEALAHVLELCKGNRDKANAAWKAIGRTPWTADALSAAFERWVEQPKGEPADASVPGVPEGDEQ